MKKASCRLTLILLSFSLSLGWMLKFLVMLHLFHNKSVSVHSLNSLQRCQMSCQYVLSSFRFIKHLGAFSIWELHYL